MNERDRIAKIYGEYERQGAAWGRWSMENRGVRALLGEREDATRRLIAAGHLGVLGEARLLEIGVGGGGNLDFLVREGATPSRVVGIDLLPERVEAARAKLPGCRIEQGDAQALPFPDASFDVVLLYTVLSSVDDPLVTARIVAKARRLLASDRPGGILWYDMRLPNPWNRNVHGISRRALARLFPDADLSLVRSLTPLPPLVRRLGPLTAPLFGVLRHLPPLRTHLFGLIRFGRSRA